MFKFWLIRYHKGFLGQESLFSGTKSVNDKLVEEKSFVGIPSWKRKSQFNLAISSRRIVIYNL